LTSFTKVLSRKTERELNYAPSENVLQELKIFEDQEGWPIFENLRMLINGKADSFSFTRDSPYLYFYARVTEENITLKMKTREDETEFRIPLRQLNLI